MHRKVRVTGGRKMTSLPSSPASGTKLGKFRLVASGTNQNKNKTKKKLSQLHTPGDTLTYQPPKQQEIITKQQIIKKIRNDNFD